LQRLGQLKFGRGKKKTPNNNNNNTQWKDKVKKGCHAIVCSGREHSQKKILDLT
jgi:hypothetical protein